MEFLIALLACFLFGAPIGLAGSILIGRGPELLTGLFSPYRGLEWPHGVQEEDPSGGWTWRLPSAERANRRASTAETASQASELASMTEDNPRLSAEAALLVPEEAEIAVPLQPVSATVHAGTSRTHSRR